MSEIVYRSIEEILAVEADEPDSNFEIKSVLSTLDPFLMMDHGRIEGSSDGFPPHGHRGFQAITYVIRGTNVHEDSRGHKGVLHAGDIQWMTAGRGIYHFEKPGPDGIEGFQLWVNLRSDLKMSEPNYQDKRSSDLPVVAQDGVEVKVIAGESMGAKSDLVTVTPVHFFDVKMQPGSKFLQHVPEGWNSYFYVFVGEVQVGDARIPRNNTVILGKHGNHVLIEAVKESRFVMLSGEPIGESIVKGDTFVMNTQEEIEQARLDLANQVNGFENTGAWAPSIRDSN